MCMDMLQKLANAELPFMVADPAQIDKVRLLDAAGHIKAFVPPVHVDLDNCARQDPAMVLEITGRGRKALSQMLAESPEALPWL